MDNEKKILEVGDVIYRRQYGKIFDRLVIDKVTNKQASAGHFKFRREYYGGTITQIGGGTYDGSFLIESDSAKSEYIRKVTIVKISNTRFENLSDNKLIAIMKIINDPE